MKKNRIPGTDLALSQLGMGCWAYGGGAYWGEQAQEDVNEVVDTALDNGVNFFDTAELYNDGKSEESLGIALKGRRREAVIGSKISTSNLRRDVLKQHCEDSLRRLQTDYIDIYMLHWPVNQKSVEHFVSLGAAKEEIPTVADAFATLKELQSEGKIRYIGLSNHGIEQMKEVLDTGVRIAVNELPFNLVSRAIEAEILPYCLEKNVGVIGYMTLQQGLLADIYPDFDSIPPAQVHSRHFSCARGGAASRHGEEGAEEEIRRLLDGMKKISKELGKPIPVLALSWAMKKRGITSTLVGSRNVPQLKMNMETAAYRLPDDVAGELDRLSLPVWKKLGNSPDYYENRKSSRIK